MNPSPINVLLYSLQIAAIVGLSGAAAAVLRAQPRVRLALWRLVIVVCLLLPGVAWLSPHDSIVSRPDGAVIALGGAIDAALPSASRPFAVVPAILLAGMMARAAWIAFGVVRLRRFRALAAPAPLGAELEATVRAMAPRAQIRCHDSVSQPVTFGFLEPVVLLPPCVLAWPLEVQRAVLLHELWHVARRDWLWLMAEQVVETMFWFHPAMWWALDRVQLAREQVVDALVLSVTGGRRAYLRAIASFADAMPGAVAAAPFLRRRHLMSRLDAMAATPRSAARSAAAAIALVAVTSGSAAAAMTWLPLQGQTADERVYDAGNGVTLPTVLKEVRPVYTEEAKAERIEGTVVMQCVVATSGEARDITIERSLDAVHGLDAAAVAALEQWRFKPGAKDGKPVRVRVHIEMTFTLK